MASHSDSRQSGKRIKMRDEFMDGLRCFRRDDYKGALLFFRVADKGADITDSWHNRYTSFHGLSRVYMGDSNGVKLCRKAAVGEIQDADVYHNLAMAEHRLGYRESAYMALRRGLRVDPEHPGLLDFRQKLVLRKKRGFIPGLKRNNFLNRMLGRLFRNTRLPFSDND